MHILCVARPWAGQQCITMTAAAVQRPATGHSDYRLLEFIKALILTACFVPLDPSDCRDRCRPAAIHTQSHTLSESETE